MAHDVSVSSSRTGRMSPQALALAVLLHVLVALALWGMSLDRPKPPEEAIDVTIERPKPPEAPPKPPPPALAPQPYKPRPEAPAREGLRPPAEITSDRPTQVPTISEQPKEVRPPQPASAEAKVPPPQPQPQPQPPPPAPSPPTTAPALPEAALPSLPSQAHTAELAPPAKPKPPPPQPHPAPPAPQKQYYAPPDVHAAMPSPSPFVNPADVVNRARASDNYLWQVARKLSQYQYFAHVNVDEGTTVVRIVIARDGRLLDVSIARSSGFPALDKGVVDGLRAGSPYAPLPADIPGARATFNLPVVSNRR